MFLLTRLLLAQLTIILLYYLYEKILLLLFDPPSTLTCLSSPDCDPVGRALGRTRRGGQARQLPGNLRGAVSAATEPGKEGVFRIS